jgi:hypothetical protein
MDLLSEDTISTTISENAIKVIEKRMMVVNRGNPKERIPR